MELIMLIIILLAGALIVKAIGMFLHAGFFVLTLPFKIIGALLGAACFILLFIPAAMIAALFPVILIVVGIILLAKNV